jgi:hypothetical protein
VKITVVSKLLRERRMRSCRVREIAARRRNLPASSRGVQAGVHGQPQHETRPPAALKAPRRAAPDRVPHQEAEIEGAGVDDEPLEDVPLRRAERGTLSSITAIIPLSSCERMRKW